MIGLEDRQALALALAIHTAQRSGARLRLASEAACIDLRTLQRWKAGDGLASGDGRPLVMLCTSRPANATQRDGPATSATGLASAPSGSTPSATRSSQRI